MPVASPVSDIDASTSYYHKVHTGSVKARHAVQWGNFAGDIAMIVASDDLHVGSLLRDNDPRSLGRMLRVESFDVTFIYALASNSHRLTRILRSAVHYDDKPRRSGYSLVR